MKPNEIAQIIPALRLKRDLHYFAYKIPEELAGQVKIGQMVEIPFRNQVIKGVVLNLVKFEKNDEFELKAIEKIVDPLPFLSRWQLELIKQLAGYYFVSMAVLLKMIMPIVPKRKKESAVKVWPEFKKLNGQGSSAIMANIYQAQKPVLLHYFIETEKIKTYIDLIEKNLQENKQVLIICPQLINVKKILQYLQNFTSEVAVFLNDLPKNRYWQEWQKIKNNQAKVIIGTRSAIFAPVDNLGLIIIDDEDNANHKQEEPNPRYNAKNVALMLRDLLKCKLIYSAQTPALNSLAKVTNKDWEYFKLTEPGDLPALEIIDRKDEFKKGNYALLSEKLQKLMSEKQQQTFLFLNRKGLATSLLCRDCGYIAKCPTCKLPLTYYNSKQLICHHCGHQQNLFLFCPACKSPSIKFTGMGTEKVELEVRKMFPGRRIIKLDFNTPLEAKNLADYDIVIGTQYAFDYLDWAKINLAGVINADTLFYLPDYRSFEKGFNLLLKLKYFLGSGNKNLIIQTSTPDNYIFAALKQADYKMFFRQEMQERKDLNYPPYATLIKLIYQSIEFNGGQEEIDEVYKAIKLKVGSNKNVVVNPPLLVYTEQVRGRFRWQIIIKVLDQAESLDFLNNIPENVIIDRDPESLL